MDIASRLLRQADLRNLIDHHSKGLGPKVLAEVFAGLEKEGIGTGLLVRERWVRSTQELLEACRGDPAVLAAAVLDQKADRGLDRLAICLGVADAKRWLEDLTRRLDPPDPRALAQCLLWRLGEKRLRLGNFSVSSLEDWVASVYSGRAADSSLALLRQGLLALWFAESLGENGLQTSAQIGADQIRSGEVKQRRAFWAVVWEAEAKLKHPVGSPEQAVAVRESLVVDDPEFWEAHCRLGFDYFRLNRTEEMERHLKLALQHEAGLETTARALSYKLESKEDSGRFRVALDQIKAGPKPVPAPVPIPDPNIEPKPVPRPAPAVVRPIPPHPDPIPAPPVAPRWLLFLSVIAIAGFGVVSLWKGYVSPHLSPATPTPTVAPTAIPPKARPSVKAAPTAPRPTPVPSPAKVGPTHIPTPEAAPTAIPAAPRPAEAAPERRGPTSRPAPIEAIQASPAAAQRGLSVVFVMRTKTAYNVRVECDGTKVLELTSTEVRQGRHLIKVPGGPRLFRVVAWETRREDESIRWEKSFEVKQDGDMLRLELNDTTVAGRLLSGGTRG